MTMRRAAATFAAPMLLLLLFPTLVLTAAPARAQEAGVVNRIKNSAQAVRQGRGVPLSPGSAVLVGDELVTGPQARLAVRFTDGTLLTLGEDTRIVVDEYVYGRDNSMILELAEGAFRVISGEVARLNPDKFALKTPLASIGIRGTDFWGEIQSCGALEVLLINGTAVTVTNVGGTVTLTDPGVGITVGSKDRIPMLPKEWSQEKKARALSSVAFD